MRTGDPALPRSLEEVARELFAPLLRLQAPSRTGWRLIGWDADHGLTLTLGHGERNLLIELEARDEARGCFARTNRFNVCARLHSRPGEELRAEERQVVEQVVRILRGRESNLPLVDRPAASRRSEVREIQAERILIPEGSGHYYINPYVGCMIGCDFCYVAHRADFSRALEGLPSLPWGRYVEVKVNAADVLREEVKHHAPGIVRLSPIVTDPYQPLEGRYRITRQCLEVLLEAGFTPAILTRAARVVEDLPLLARFERAAVGFSIPTDDDHVRLIFEAGADPIEERWNALAQCHEAGLQTYGVIQPMLPMSPERLVARMAPIIRAVRIDRMYELSRSRDLYDAIGCLDAMEPAFFDRTEAILRSGFAAAGVALDELDELGAALGWAG